MRTGIFGGTFNPIHYGHLRAAEEVRFSLCLDRILFIPSATPPLKRDGLVPVSHRFAMTSLAVERNDGFMISDIEIKAGGRSYTVNTVRMLRDFYPDDELFLILGTDAFLDLPNWWRPDELIQMVDFAVVTRPGFEIGEIMRSPYIDKGPGSRDQGPERILASGFWLLTSGKRLFPVPVTPLGISSTAIRELCSSGKSIRYLVPEPVEEYIISHGLYF
ncbi:MAG: nicotinate (nicotinamide) nucleotide adenylyltransferase [Nitrospirales bacterium]|nr:nicotinate (nicotinamide) nucleotide adenylyltransferase [Nitrospirales bacterium]